MKILLRILAALIPGDYLRTAFYRNVIYRPRKLLRDATHRFYRMDPIYEVLEEARDKYRRDFSVLEFGTAAGYSFTKMLYATRYLGMEDRVVVHGFDSFEGLPAPAGPADEGQWLNEYAAGDYRAPYEELKAYCEENYSNFELHKGDFSDTIDEEFLQGLQTRPPILVWIDCDYYSSARVVMDRLWPHIPNGCVIYFDDYHFNFGSRLTGEARLVHEIQNGLLGDDVDLVLDRDLSWDSRRVYRFVRLGGIRFEKSADYTGFEGKARARTNDSPLP